MIWEASLYYPYFFVMSSNAVKIHLDIASHDHSGSEHHMICFKTCISDQCHFSSLTNSICIWFICLMKSTCFYPIQVDMPISIQSFRPYLYWRHQWKSPAPPMTSGFSNRIWGVFSDRDLDRFFSALCLHEKHNARFCGDLPKRQLWQPKARLARFSWESSPSPGKIMEKSWLAGNSLHSSRLIWFMMVSCGLIWLNMA